MGERETPLLSGHTTQLRGEGVWVWGPHLLGERETPLLPGHTTQLRGGGSLGVWATPSHHPAQP